jgi:Rhodopirellula transposase DDE domain
MTLLAVDCDPVAARLLLIRPHLDERAWRLLLGAEAKVLGRGGIKLVAAAGGVHPDTVAAGVRELDGDEPIPGRVRRPGAGRPPTAVSDPDLVDALDALVDPVSRGDPQSPLRWTTKSTATLAAELTAVGHPVSARTVAKLLKQAGYSLQANSKTLEGAQHPDRDAQFGYLNTQVERFQADGNPVISVDTKKKELVGNYKAAGREWRPKGRPTQVKVHDFADKQLGKVAPYGVYDITANTGWVNVGTDADTGAFAVESIRRWWTTMGATSYPGSDKLLITADSGGSNGSRLRLWKTELAAFAAEAGLDITVCHLPPGTSKWNKIEHRLFSAITRNWRARPLESHEVVIETLRATTTSTGLTVNAVLDTTTYERGIKITDKQIATLEATQLHRHEFHGDWNYTLTADHTTTRPTEP